MNKFLDKIIRHLRQHILFQNLPDKFGTVLDIGCGPKPWFLYLEPERLHGAKIIGLDNREYQFAEPKHFSFVRAELERILPFPDDSFDLVTMLAVLEHLPYPEDIVTEIYRILKPDGTLILTTPSPLSKPLLEFLAFRLHLIDEGEIRDHKHYFPLEELRQLLTNNNLTIKQLRYFELGFNVFARVTK